MDNLYASLEEKYNLPQGALSAVSNVESNDKDTAVSPKGAKGRFQFMPKTAEAYNVDVNDPISSAHGAAQYLSDLTKKYGSFQAALAHYNGGTKAGEAVSAGNEPPAKETKDYVAKVSSKIAVPSDLEWQPIGQEAHTKSSEVPKDLEWQPVGKTVEKVAPKESIFETLSYQPEPKDYKKMGFGEQLKEGFKKSFEDTGAGIVQLATQFKNKTPKELSLENEFEQQRRKEYEPLMETGGGVTGNIAGQIAQSVGLGGALKGVGLKSAGEALINPTTYKAALGAGALQGALQPTIEGESKTFNTLAGAGAGGVGLGVVNAAGRIAQPVKSALDTAGQKAVDILKKAGVPLDAAQATGSTMLHRVKSSLMDNPITAGEQKEFMAKQQAAYNRAVLNTIGEDAHVATSEVMGNAQKRIDNVFKNVLNNNSVDLTDDVVSKIGHIQELANDAEKKPIANMANRIFKNIDENGKLSGQNAYAIKKDLDMYASSSDSTLAHYAKELRSTLMNSINDSLSDVDKEAFQAARTQFGNMKTIEGAIDKEGGGNISPSRLAQIMSTKANRSKSIYGKGNQDLVELAQAGNKILPEKLANSGTIARAAAQLVGPAALGAAYGAYQGDWETAAKGAAGGVVLPKLIQKAINSPATAKYLEQGLKQSPLRTMLELPKKAGLQKVPPAALNAYLQSMPPAKKE